MGKCHQTLTEHDIAGNVIREESRVPRNAAGDATDPDDPPVVTRHAYDALNRRYKTCHDWAPLGSEMDPDEPWEPGCVRAHGPDQ